MKNYDLKYVNYGHTLVNSFAQLNLIEPFEPTEEVQLYEDSEKAPDHRYTPTRHVMFKLLRACFGCENES